ncbi:FMN-dependent NADH-azoreductase [Novosphingobium sp. FSY-8]|uniref:FMN dependent NADH:quinone oxidoreductase n=1 Tax=Novosphingobium ovatum TaxID=1908523 RepID=A0ABW9XHV3_9SPHN|nr:NAD(P)H-dependent oxidoreductase [Novosphingobium ovatum]NBC38151.1 FMN-dependent NADH-azoreductase [Novosphingobium ovatum]
MSHILVIRSAATGDASVSNQLIDTYVEAARAANPDVTVTVRDLDANPVPHVTQASLAGIGRAAPEGGQFAAARALQDELIAEVFAADTLVIGLPLYNFGMPSTLKAWFDYVARAGTTFQYTAQGPEGLVKDTKAIIAHARAGQYDDASGFPFAVPHVKALLGFVGVTDVQVVTAEGLAFGPDAASAAITAARAQIADLA